VLALKVPTVAGASQPCSRICCKAVAVIQVEEHRGFVVLHRVELVCTRRSRMKIRFPHCGIVVGENYSAG
jgi:hypothetical protein